MIIKQSETKIIGSWSYVNGKIIEDENCKRINSLKETYLIKIQKSISGWEILYQDPKDNRYWELQYTQSELSGGGPPSLIRITEIQAKEKYGSDID